MSHPLDNTHVFCHHDHKPMDIHADVQSHHDRGVHSHHVHPMTPHRPRQRKALSLCIALTAGMMLVELICGFLFGSLMLISDAIHMFSHAASLGISLLALLLANRKVGEQFSFGLYRIEILAALFNGIGLAVFSVGIVYAAVGRILHPMFVPGFEVTVVAVVGLAVNLATALILQRAGLEDLNTKSAFLHMLADTFSSVAIVAGGILMTITRWSFIDPVLAMIVAVVVAIWSRDLLRDSVFILLERKPTHVKIEQIKDHLKREYPQIKDIHDLHVWEITSQFVCLSAHLVLEDVKLSEAHSVHNRIHDSLTREFGIGHIVLQVEC